MKATVAVCEVRISLQDSLECGGADQDWANPNGHTRVVLSCELVFSQMLGFVPFGFLLRSFQEIIEVMESWQTVSFDVDCGI